LEPVCVDSESGYPAFSNKSFRKTETHATVNFVMTNIDRQSACDENAERPSGSRAHIVHLRHVLNAGSGQERKNGLWGSV
jgi:hypothetical protein